MRKAKVLTVLLAAGLAFSGPLVASAKKPPAESQKGGLPALEDRVDLLDGEVTTLQALVTDLQGQNNFAVVGSGCSLTTSSSNAGTVTAASSGTGLCTVTFAQDVSACSAVATIVGSTPGEITVTSATKLISGDSVLVSTFTVGTTTPADAAFNLTVTCP